MESDSTCENVVEGLPCQDEVTILDPRIKVIASSIIWFVMWTEDAYFAVGWQPVHCIEVAVHKHWSPSHWSCSMSCSMNIWPSTSTLTILAVQRSTIYGPYSTSGHRLPTKWL